MYGTIARMLVKPGREVEFLRHGEDAADIPGFVFEHIFQSETDPREYWLVVGFESRDAYRANAESSDQHARYEAYRALLDAEPEWHDGEIAWSRDQAGATAG